MSAPPGGPPLPTPVRRLVGRLVARCAPDEVVLFGSAISGTATERSDIDLLIVASSQFEADELMRRRAQLTAGVFPRVDLVVSSREELEQAHGERATFLRSVRQHGVVLHRRNGGEV